jgi:hypothetical protein
MKTLAIIILIIAGLGVTIGFLHTAVIPKEEKKNLEINLDLKRDRIILEIINNRDVSEEIYIRKIEIYYGEISSINIVMYRVNFYNNTYMDIYLDEKIVLKPGEKIVREIMLKYPLVTTIYKIDLITDRGKMTFIRIPRD